MKKTKTFTRKTFKDVFQQTKETLSQSSRLVQLQLVETEAEQLLVAAIRSSQGIAMSRLQFFSEMQNNFPQEALAQLEEMTIKRVQGIPLQYLTGFQTFLDHEYDIGPEVLIPRPETEWVCHSAILELTALSVPPSLGLEIGIGSGILSIELLSQFQLLKMVASEISLVAREYAHRNARRILGSSYSDRLHILEVEDSLEVCEPFLRQITKKADFLIMNPPYLADESETDSDVFTYEPHSALFGPKYDPSWFYRQTAADAKKLLKKSGFVFAELPHERAKDIVEIFNQQGWKTKVLPDLNGRERVLIARVRKSHG